MVCHCARHLTVVILLRRDKGEDRLGLPVSMAHVFVLGDDFIVGAVAPGECGDVRGTGVNDRAGNREGAPFNGFMVVTQFWNACILWRNSSQNDKKKVHVSDTVAIRPTCNEEKFHNALRKDNAHYKK